MSDLISRQDALKPFCIAPDGTRIPEVDCDNFPVEFSVAFIKKHLLSLPSAEPKTKCIAQIRIDRDDLQDLVNEKVNEIVDMMSEPKTGEWIPVSEKPKDEKRTYLVQLDSGGMRSCRWTNANPFWTELTTDWHWNMFDIPQYCNVVAWMDLEPYKGGDGE